MHESTRFCMFSLNKVINVLTQVKVLGGGSVGNVFHEGLKVIQGHTLPVRMPSQTAVQLAHHTATGTGSLYQVHFTTLQAQWSLTSFDYQCSH